MHPADMIFYWAAATPEQLAIVQPNASLTYRELARAVDAIASRIDRLGLRPGEPVAVNIPEAGRLVATCFALLRRGIPVAPIGPRLLPFLRSHGIVDVITAGEGLVTSGGRNIQFNDTWLRPAEDTQTASHVASARQPSLAGQTNTIFFTSGTTGTPKAVSSPGSALAARMDLDGHTVEELSPRVVVMPGLTSFFGFVRTASLLFSGRTACCFGGDYTAILRMIDLYGVGTVIASPQQVVALADAAEAAPGLPLTSLRQVILGGAFASESLFQRVQSTLCRNVVSTYASTESGLIASALYSSMRGIPQAVGFATPGTVIQIVDENGSILPPDTPGRIRCRTSYFAKGFRAARHGEAIDDDDIWWYSGDLGTLRADGILCVLGRADDVINLGGVKMAGSLLDQAAGDVEGIRDAAVCAIAGASGVEELWVIIVPEPDAAIEDIKARLARASDFSGAPFTLAVVKAIPRNDLGKVERQKMKAMAIEYSKQLARQ